MLQITGKVVNVFTKDGGTNKDGQAYDATHKVQLLGQVDLPNGDIQNDLIDLTVDNLDDWKKLTNQKITVDVGAFAPQKGKIVYFIKKGSKPVAGLLSKGA